MSHFIIHCLIGIKTEAGCGELNLQCHEGFSIHIEGFTWIGKVCNSSSLGLVSCCFPSGWSFCSVPLSRDHDLLAGVRAICDGQHTCTIGKSRRICSPMEQYPINYQSIEYTCRQQSHLSMYTII